MSRPFRPSPGLATAVSRAVVAVMAVAWPIAGCSAQPDIEESDIVGVWKSNRKGTLEFRSDGRFVATDVTLGPNCDPESERPMRERVSGTGTWKVGAFSDENPGAKMTFKPRGGPVHSCPVWSAFTTDDPTDGMRLVHDDGTGERYRPDE
ncbi:hypothetical protein [Streptomyces winkii]|uniref:hypothetical protein n=1 Tax=Streptomyces winkii TaxID=3051178 RepID=UPI0028D26004|nr:hypothetical protein [Streptomyces sp. DSM 40971]